MCSCLVIVAELFMSLRLLVVRLCVVHTLVLALLRLAGTLIPHTRVMKTRCLVPHVSTLPLSHARVGRRSSKTFVVHSKAKRSLAGLFVVNSSVVASIIVKDHVMRAIVENVRLLVGS